MVRNLQSMAECLDQGLVSWLQAGAKTYAMFMYLNGMRLLAGFRVSTVMVSHVALYAGLLGDANWNRKQTEGMGVLPVRPYGCAPLGSDPCETLWVCSIRK